LTTPFAEADVESKKRIVWARKSLKNRNKKEKRGTALEDFTSG